MLPNMSDGRQRASKAITLIGHVDWDNRGDLQTVTSCIDCDSGRSELNGSLRFARPPWRSACRDALPWWIFQISYASPMPKIAGACPCVPVRCVRPCSAINAVGLVQ